jgi:hypothetical protein
LIFITRVNLIFTLRGVTNNPAMSEAINFSVQSGKLDIAREGKKQKPFRGLTRKADQDAFTSIRRKFMPLLRKYPKELPTAAHRESALYVIYYVKFEPTPPSGMMPSYAPKLLWFLATRENREDGYVF